MLDDFERRTLCFGGLRWKAVPLYAGRNSAHLGLHLPEEGVVKRKKPEEKKMYVRKGGFWLQKPIRGCINRAIRTWSS